MNSRELATVLAALRFWQRRGLGGASMPSVQAEWDIATNEGSVEPLDEDAIDELCERLNCDGDPQRDALVQLLLAYAKNDSGDGSIEWEDLDQAVEMAKDALPGEYERIVAELATEDEEKA